MRGIITVVDALMLSADLHRTQMRKDGETPYINHPMAVMHLLATLGIDDPDVLAAAVLHDTMEDCRENEDQLEFPDTVEGRIKGCTNHRVFDLVMEVSDDKSLDHAERKRLQVENAHRLSLDARLIRIADKTCNLRDLLLRKPLKWSRGSALTYANWCKSVVDTIRGTHFALEDQFDLAYSAVIEHYTKQ